jgi:DNA-binding XRE family transcriptional regulator
MPRATDIGEDWETVLAENPKILWGLVADVVKAVKAGEGERRTGRRPAATVRSLDELYEVLFPTAFATLPFREALYELMQERGLSQRALATEVGLNQSSINRLLNGGWAPDIEMLELLAGKMNVRPTYWSEYRAMKLGQLVTNVFLTDPRRSADAVRALVGAPA